MPYPKKRTGTADSMERKAKAKPGAKAAEMYAKKATKEMAMKKATQLNAKAKEAYLKELNSLKPKKKK